MFKAGASGKAAVAMSENLGVVKVGATVEDSVEPDLAVFSLRFGKKCKTQRECADDFAAERERVVRALEPFGIADDLGFSGYLNLPRFR